MFIKHQGKGEQFDLSARRHNAIADATNDYLGRKLRRGGVAGYAQNYGFVEVANETGANWAIGHVVAIGDPVNQPGVSVDKFLTRLVHSGTQPTSADYGLFGVCVEPIKDGGVGLVAVSGVVQAQVVVPSNGTWIEFADVTDAAYTLTARPEGTARILWRESGTGTKWATVLLGCSAGGRELKAVADEAIVADASGTVSIWHAGADTSFNLEAELNWMHGDEDISTGKELIIRYFADEAAWVVVHAECETGA